MTRRPLRSSLRSRLVWRLVPLQASLLALLVLLVVGTLWGTGLLLDDRDEDHVIDIVQQAVTRDAAGGLTLRSTPELRHLRAEIPDLWFIIRDRQGHVLSEGAVPPEFARIGDALDHISQARLGWQLLDDDPRKPAARLKRVETAAGNVQVLTATQGKMSAGKAVLALATVFAGFVLPSLVLMTLVTLVATPLVVRRALAGLGIAADRARQIDIDKRGTRLPLTSVPTEIAPLVTAVNDALARLDEGYARHKRFVADAAHELRTPIAILTTRLETLPASPDKTRLLEDAARLANLAEQLLDIQRLDQSRATFTRIDLVTIGRHVAADLAPLAIAAGYQIEFDCEAEPIESLGDQIAIERVLTNLVQNAIQHAGRRGTISIGVSRPATIDVVDQGAGIPEEQRARIFEPFYRLHPLDRGAGLGLNLVREIVQLHGGHVTVLDGPQGGACFRVSLPAAPPAR
jgi:signal transduction histidine kinase